MTSSSAHTPTRVLVTGASGSIGTATCDYLASQGIAVSALSLDGPFPAGADRVFPGDASSPTVVDAALEDVDAVVHLAAIPHPNLGTPHQVFTTNVTSTFTVLAAAGERGIRRAVIASSINASGLPLNRFHPLPAYFPIDEEIPTDPEDAYSLSKIVDEQTARMAATRWAMDIVALRFPFVGAGERLTRRREQVSENPGSFVSEGWAYLDLRDAARAVLLALTASITGSQVIGLSARDTILDAPTAELLAEYAPGIPLTRAIEGRDTAIDTSRATTLLGFSAEYSIHEATAKAHQK
jgi:nucleoside-diphosphate-sugar epimerase